MSLASDGAGHRDYPVQIVKIQNIEWTFIRARVPAFCFSQTIETLKLAVSYSFQPERVFTVRNSPPSHFCVVPEAIVIKRSSDCVCVCIDVNE